jgi:hypothetical protein
MADKESQKRGAIKSGSLIGGEGTQPSVASKMASKLFSVQTQAIKSYGVYRSNDYSGWRKKNGFGSINASAIAKQAAKLKKDLESKNVSMSDIKTVNAFLEKYHSPLTDLDKREAKLLNQEMSKAKRKLPFHRKSSLINTASSDAEKRRKEEDK